MTPRDSLSPQHQQILDQIDAHGEAQQPDPPPAPIVGGSTLMKNYFIQWASTDDSLPEYTITSTSTFELATQEQIECGSWKAISYEILHGTIFTVIDEILHRLKWLDNFDWRFDFCQWAWRNRVER